jgi:SAM-dependent methyltransferase
VESVNFDRAAGYYDKTRALPAATMADLTGLLAAELADRQPCLEIGVGTGRFALPLRAAGIAMAGTDISAAMLERLAANAAQMPVPASPVPLAQADATRLPFAAGSFGSVLAVHVLHLIPDWRVAVDEAIRVLAPGGALVASFPTDNRAVGATAGTGLRRQPAGPGDAAAGPGDAAAGPDDPAAEAGAAGLSRDAVAPWAAAMREAARRHGMTRKPFGAQAPAAVADYLAGRATARELSPVPVRTVWTLGEAIEHVERQLFSWSWPYTAAQAAAVAGDMRGWAAQAGVALDTAHEAATAVRCWAFELR